LSNLSFEDPLNYDVVTRFWQQAHIMVFAWTGLGFAAFALFLKRWRFAAPGLAVAMVAAQAAIHYPALNQHGNWAVRQYAEALLKPLPQGALLFAHGDVQTHPLRYLQVCEGYRTDVRVLDRALLSYTWTKRIVNKYYADVSMPPGLLCPGTGYQMKDLLSANFGRFPIFMSDLYTQERSGMDMGPYKMWPFALTSQVILKSEPYDLETYLRTVDSAFGVVDVSMLDRYRRFPWEAEIWNEYWSDRNRQGFELVTTGTETKKEEFVRAGLRVWEDVVSKQPDPASYLFKDIGLAYSQPASKDPQYRPKVVEFWNRYLQLIPPTDPDYPKIQQQ